MKPATRAWVNKAEGDGETARRETRVRKRPNYDAACFHAQQAAEKYLKAVLTEEGRPFPKIHDLVKLSEGCIDRMAHLRLYEADLDVLSRYAIAFRYAQTVCPPGAFEGSLGRSTAICSCATG